LGLAVPLLENFTLLNVRSERRTYCGKFYSKFSLCLTKFYVMKTCGRNQEDVLGSGGIAPRILNLGN